jgi:thiol:disulfide interchange protein
MVHAPKVEPKKTIRLKVPKRKQSKPTNLRAEERPEIVLKGDVAVAEATAARPEPKQAPAVLVATDQRTIHEEGSKKDGSDDKPKKDEKQFSSRRDKSKNKGILAIESSDSETKSRSLAPSEQRAESSVKGFTPASVRAQHGKKRAPHRKKQRSKLKDSTSHTNWFAVTAIVLLVVFIGFVILTLRIDTIVIDGGSANSWSLDWSS